MSPSQIRPPPPKTKSLFHACMHACCWLFWVTAGQMRRAMIARNRALRELISSELEYTAALSHIIKVGAVALVPFLFSSCWVFSGLTECCVLQYYVHPVRLDGSMVSAADADTIFNWLEVLWECHSEVVEQLSALYDRMFPDIEGLGCIIEGLVSVWLSQVQSTASILLIVLDRLKEPRDTFSMWQTPSTRWIHWPNARKIIPCLLSL